MARAPAPANLPGGSPNEHPDIVVQTRLDAARNTMVCAQCHSFRDIMVDGFTAGSNYYDYYRPVLEYILPDKQDPLTGPTAARGASRTTLSDYGRVNAS